MSLVGIFSSPLVPIFGLLLPLAYVFKLIEHKVVFLYVLLSVFINVGALADLSADIGL